MMRAIGKSGRSNVPAGMNLDLNSPSTVLNIYAVALWNESYRNKRCYRHPEYYGIAKHGRKK